MKRLNRLCTRAFTLVEITLAIGITSFAVLSVVGVLAVGMQTLREAIDTTVQAQITQEIVGTLKQADFTTLAEATTWEFVFDERGVSTTEDGLPIQYTAGLQVDPATLSGGTSNPDLQKVRITITSVAAPGSPHTFSTFVANNGQ